MSIRQLMQETPPTWTLWVRLVWLLLMLNALPVYRWWKRRRRQKLLEKMNHLLNLFEFMQAKGVLLPHLITEARKIQDELDNEAQDQEEQES